MICEIIKKPGQQGSGGGRDAFAPGVHYVCSKAARIELRNIASSRWQDAPEEMLLTSQLSARVQKPYYHIVLSWHENEQPTDDQMIAAMEHMIHALGLDEHQMVIGTHHDTRRKHIHGIANTVHPITGKVWSKSKDHQKAEAACRQIELEQGWSHDRGRFDFDVVKKSGRKTAVLKPNPKVWDKKTKDRAAGKRRKKSGDLKFEKSTGYVTFEHGIPAPLKQKFAAIVSAARSWQGLHTALCAHGLTYYKFGSGARVGIIGSTEFAKASAFGAKFTISKMVQAFGPYEDPEKEHLNDPITDHAEIASLTGKLTEQDDKATRASAFKVTLLRRMYIGIHIDPKVAQAIRFVGLADKSPRISFRDGASVVDHGAKLSTSRDSMETRATMIALAKAKGWSAVRPTGSPAFVRQMALECARAGLPVYGVPPDIQALADNALEKSKRAQRPVINAAQEMQKSHLADQVDREDRVASNAQEREWKARAVAEISAEAEAARDAIGSGRGPGSAALRKIAQEDRNGWIADLPDMRAVSHPQPAPDAAKQDPAGRRRIAHQVRKNDQDEMEQMKRFDIGVIAGLGGWSDVSRTHPDSADKHGTKYRIYQRGSDTLKASLLNGKWLWTSNKSGEAGSVIDLWLHDNPGKTLGHARVAFREIMGVAPTMAHAAPVAPHDHGENEDHTDARRRWEEAPFINDHRSYAEQRGISRKTLTRFRGEVRIGAFGGIYFAHRNPDTGYIQGFEQRWQKHGQKNKARFAKGGRKTVNVLGNPSTATRMAVSEGGLDALAFAELDARDDTIYVSTGGGFGPLSVAALHKLAKGKIVMSAFDNDAAGEQLHDKLRRTFPDAERFAPPSRVAGAATICKDWLDVLVAVKSANTNQPAPNPERSLADTTPIPEEENLPEPPLTSPDDGPEL